MENKEFNKKHLLFNMATGSGKTLMMASLILYCYLQGYRNFLFFVHSRNIIQKTRSNFIDTHSSKYLFAKPIVINGRVIPIKETSNFNQSQDNSINICMTTIQGLHSSLMEEKENSFTFQDFKKNKIVMLGDEAHHFNRDTKLKDKIDDLNLFSESDSNNWEITLERIFRSHKENLFLEFTATVDWGSKSITKKYIPRIIYQYDLRQFRKEKYSKEIEVLQSNLNIEQLMLQAVILSEYRRILSMKYGVPFYKPVILFKSKYENKSKKEPTVLTSNENQDLFSNMVENLTVHKITDILPNVYQNDIIKKAIEFFQEEYSGELQKLVEQIKDQFQLKYLLNVNEGDIRETASSREKKEKEKIGYYLNTLEEPTNSFRAIFSVDKLNEGWDVLNLFDIVRLYNTRDADTKNKIAGKTTISEAQLIGRGARYYPFKTAEWENSDIRKYDELLEDERKILETLYYHCEHNPRYISELKEEMIKQGLKDSDEDIRIIQIDEEYHKKLKGEFIYSNIKKKKTKEKNEQKYKNALELLNEKLKVQQFVYRLKTGERQETTLLEVKEKDLNTIEFDQSLVSNQKLNEKQLETIQLCAWLSQNINFSKYRDVIVNTKQFLKDLIFDFRIEYASTQNKDNIDWEIVYYEALERIVYPKVVQILHKGYSEYYGTREFTRRPILEVFKPRIKKIGKTKDGTQQIFNGTIEHSFFPQNFFVWDSKLEEQFFRDMQDVYRDLTKKGYSDIILIRNDQQLAIYHFENGRAFYPDFILFCRYQKREKILQFFLEIKGELYQPQDQWKEDFLLSLEDKITYRYINSQYKILGFEFYPESNQRQFMDNLKQKIERSLL